MAQPSRSRWGWCLAAAVPLAVLVGLRTSQNIHVVIAGQVWRSAQLGASDLERLASEQNLRSVLNLRGARPGVDWYEAELQVARRLHLEHDDFELSAERPVTPEQARALIEIMRRAPKPLLIHCEGGADRSGLGAALYRYALARALPGEAASELSAWYGHLPLFRPRVAAMDQSFLAYVEAFEGPLATDSAPSRLAPR